MKATRAILAAALAAAAMPSLADPGDIARGRYVLQIGGCNDCHTPGYAATGGKVPESQWVTGDAVGWQGGWGTTYPANLRLYMQGLSEDEWLAKAKALVTRPPMPWFALRDMSRDDLRAVYRYIRHLGPAGRPAPAYVPPGKAALTPVVLFPAEPTPSQASASR